MSLRRKSLNRLAVESPCPMAWEEMAGDEGRRHCALCDRSVFDFASMTEREIAARLQATRGRLCGRITRGSDGLLVVLEPSLEPMAPAASAAGIRPHPLAATLITAVLGIASSGAQTSPAEAASATESPARSGVSPTGDLSSARPEHSGGGSASLFGVVQDDTGYSSAGFQVVVRNSLDGRQWQTVTAEDGAFSFDDLDAGAFSLTVSAEGFGPASLTDVVLETGQRRLANLTISPTVDESSVNTGIIAVSPEPLRKVFGQSTLAALATVGATWPAADGELVTELRLNLVFKGRGTGRSVRLFRQVPEESDATFVPGTRVLALLSPREGARGRAAAADYESADYFQGVRALSDEEWPVYRERIGQLARVMDEPSDPRDLSEWLVAAAEEPHLRGEAASEIQQALGALDDVAEAQGISPERAATALRFAVSRHLDLCRPLEGEPSLQMIAAFISDAHRSRLAEALFSTRTHSDGDLALYEVVERFDHQAATAWLLRSVRDLKTESDASAIGLLAAFAETTANPRIDDAMRVAWEALEKLAGDLSSRPTPEETRRYLERSAAFEQEAIEAIQREIGR